MNGLHSDKSGAGISTVQILGLLERIRAGDESAKDDLVQLLTLDFEARSAGKRYFPISILREACRQYLKHSSLGDEGKLVFYKCSSEAILSAMIASSIPGAARVGGVLRAIALRSNRRDPGEALLLLLHYISGLNWGEIAALTAAGKENIEPERTAAELASELSARGLSAEVLSEQNLRPRGQVTLLLEKVRDGERSLGEVVANEGAKLRRQAEHLIRLEGGNISLQAGDLVNEMFLRMPKAPEKSPVNHLEFDTLTKRIMRHILIDRARKPVPSQSKFSSELSNDLSTSPIVDERLLQEEVLSVVCQVLTEMRQTDRETAGMLKAALFDGADQKEIAKLYAVSIPTVKRRIKDARDKIRERLGLE